MSYFFLDKLRECDIQKPVNGVANLVLVCHSCNRGHQGKFDRLPSVNLLERLHKRNEYLITSHHLLRETLITHTGFTEPARRSFLQDAYNCATLKWVVGKNGN